MIYLAQYRQVGIKIIPKIKIKVACFAGGHEVFLFISILKMYRLVFPASQAINRYLTNILRMGDFSRLYALENPKSRVVLYFTYEMMSGNKFYNYCVFLNCI